MSAGFQVSSNQSSGDYTGSVREFDIAVGNADRLAVGDVVVLTGTANATTGIAGVGKASQSARIAGVISSFAPNIANESFNDATGLAASTAGTAFVVIDKNVLFEVESNSTLAITDVGLNADAVVTAATQTGGLTISNMVLAASTKNTTNTLHFKIHKLLLGATSKVFGDRAVVSIAGSLLQGDQTGV